MLVSSGCLAAGAGGRRAQADYLVQPRHDSRIFGLLPNYRTIPNTLRDVKPMSPGEKWKLATQESFDPASFLLAGAFAGVGQIDRQFPSWGQGVEGFGRRYAAAIGDQVIGDYLTEAAFPILLHEDPRYFRMGQGTFLHRIGYAVGRIVITRTDAGSNRANYSEFLGSVAAAGIANAYNPAEDRSFGNTVQKFGTQVATDALFNVLKEFWPDIHQKLFHGSEGRNPQSGSSVR